MNPERRVHYNATSRAWARRNPDKAREIYARWYSKNQMAILMYRALRVLAFPEEQRAKNSRYYRENKQSENQRSLAWYRANKEKATAAIRRRRASSDKMRRADNLRYETNVNFRIAKLVRGRVVQALKKNYKAEATARLVGCSFDDLRIYLESKFEVGMSWANHGRGDGKWHIDHIIPCALFDLTKPEHQRRCFHFSNLQPLWEPANLAKAKKAGSPQFQLL